VLEVLYLMLLTSYSLSALLGVLAPRRGNTRLIENEEFILYECFY
jgi:hypothetical protein